MRLQGDGGEVSVGYLDAGGVLLFDKLGDDRQAGVGRGGADVVEDRLIVGQWDTGPVLADLTEQAMIDRIPLGGAAGVVTDGDLEAMRVDEACLESILEAANARRVAATGVGEHQQFAGVGVVLESFGLPPAQQVVSGEVGVSWEVPTTTKPRLAVRS